MTYGYIRVSTDSQTTDNQRLVIEDWCCLHNLSVDNWISETVSGTKKPTERKLGFLFEKLQPKDVVIVTEISRLGRSLTMVFDVIQVLLEKKVLLYAIKENFNLSDDIQSKVLAFAFSLSAEIERNMISERTKAGLARARAKGKIIGHPKGYKLYNVKLRKHENEIRMYLFEGKSIYFIAKKYGVKWETAKRFVNEFMNMEKPKPLSSRPKKHGHPSILELEYFTRNS